MSELSYLEKLLDGYEVEWLSLGDVTQYEQPTKYLVKAKNYHNEFITPVLTAGKTFILGYTDETNGIYKASQKPVIIFDDFTTANKWVDFDFKAKSSAMKMIISSDDVKFSLKYVYFWLNTLPNELIDGNHKRQWISNYLNIKIPMPCPTNPEKSITIQTEIVRILDKFTALTAELITELTTRKKQYNYYRDQLLNFGGDAKSAYLKKLLDGAEIEWLSLGNLTTIKTGKSINKNLISDNPGVYAVINSGKQPLGFINKWNTDNDPIGITSRGAGVGSITWKNGKYFRGNLNYSATISSDSLNIRFLYHALLSKQKDIHKLCTFDGIPALNASSLKSLLIPIPCPSNPEKSLAIQSEIVRILDKFDKLTSSITEGLPREIELRQKQYEYYRDLLFSFPKPETVSV